MAINIKAFLRTIAGFDRLRDSELERLANIACVRTAAAGQPIDVQGQPAEKFCILESGRLGVVLELDFGVARQSYMVTTLGPGQMFAWSGLVGNPHYTAGSKCLTDCRYLEFDVGQLLKLFEEDPQLGYVMMRLVAQTIASRLKHIQLQLAQQCALNESAE